MNPEIVQGPDGNQETYRVHLPGAGSFRCSETELGFEVSAAVTVQYRYDSWDQHLREWSTPEWLVIGPLFNIQAEPATAVAAVHLPHVLCLAGGQADISQMRIAHVTDVGMTLEEPTGVRPFHAVLENPSFSLYGVIFICSSCLRIPVHSLVLIYQAVRLADTTLHIYLIPSDRSLEKVNENLEQHWGEPGSPATREQRGREISGQGSGEL
ncbi:caspase recruitment domain-containing protein 8-like [Mauremys mutica]|uniref:caspase recruitment domain-containing protein 8-like n=1 Tax=Mauremys mutica TaxID=74926 RepID=UPI001D167AF7|nr:caspase recruitment domain-containing protein 8-like [Mauremys mutica]